jgi:hypothetical protein
MEKGILVNWGFTDDIRVTAKMWCEKHGYTSLESVPREKLFPREYDMIVKYFTETEGGQDDKN